MKTIFKGNPFSIVWNIIDRSTNHPFEFTGMKVEVGLYSDSFNFPLQSYNVNNGTITAVIEANTLPAGVFNIMCRYSTDHEQSYCTYRNAFQISNRPCHASEIVEIESYASHIDPSSEDPDAPDYSKCQLTAEELFKEKFRLPQLTANRAIADEHGNRITDTYVTRNGITNHIKETYNQQFLENPPLITEGYITPEMLSEETKQMLENTGQTITNLPDGEDLQSVHGVLKLADKQYNPNSYSGLGRRILRKNIVAGVNVLTQSMMQWPNTIYVIQYDYDLKGETITVPEGCVLDFQGGSLNRGVVEGCLTKIISPLNCIFNDIILKNRWDDFAYPEWFGAVSDGITDCYNSIIAMLNAPFSKYKFIGNVYYLGTGIHHKKSNFSIDLTTSTIEGRKEQGYENPGCVFGFVGENISVTGGTIRVNTYEGQGLTRAGYDNAFSFYGKNIVIDKVTIDCTNAKGWRGIDIQGGISNNVKITNCTILGSTNVDFPMDTGISSIYANYPDEDGELGNFFISNNYINRARVGIIVNHHLAIRAETNIQINGNNIENCTDGIYISGTGNYNTANNVIINGNIIKKSSRQAIYLADSTNSIVTSNICDEIDGSGIVITRSKACIKDNFLNNTKEKNESTGINEVAVEGIPAFVYLDGNYINGFYRCIRVDSENVIKNNYCHNYTQFCLTNYKSINTGNVMDKNTGVVRKEYENIYLDNALLGYSIVSHNEMRPVYRDEKDNHSGITYSENGYSILTKRNPTGISPSGPSRPDTINLIVQQRGYIHPRIGINLNPDTAMDSNAVYKDGDLYFDKQVNTLVLYKNEAKQSKVALITTGTTEERPILESYQKGLQYFDTTLNKPIWWTGEKWVDATGAEV